MGYLGLEWSQQFKNNIIQALGLRPIELGYSYGALSLQEILNPSLVSLRNNIEGSDNRDGILGIDGATTSSIEDVTNNKIGAVVKFGDSSTNMAPTSTMDDVHSKSNIEEEPSNSTSSVLDLTLKL